jgi:hypothetical protein
VRVHLTAEHALQLEPADRLLQPLGVAPDIPRRGLIALPFGELQQLGRIGDPLGGAVDLLDGGTEPRALPSELLSALRLRPDRRILELPPYLLEALFLEVVLKETPVARRCARRGL